MKLISKTLWLSLTATAMTLGLGPGLFAATSTSLQGEADVLFSTVPMGDPTYGRLSQLEKTGLLPTGASQPPLTRYEVAKDILTAQSRYDKIVVAQHRVGVVGDVEGDHHLAAYAVGVTLDHCHDGPDPRLERRIRRVAH